MKILFGAESGIIASHASYLETFGIEGLCVTLTGKEGASFEILSGFICDCL